MTTHEGTLYTVRAIKVRLSGDPRDLWMERYKTPLPFSGELWALPLTTDEDECVEIERIRAHTIRQANRPDRYIVIDHELREILEAPFLGEIADAKYQLRMSHEDHLRSAKLYRETLNRVVNFLALPWWRRVWLAFRGRV